MSIKCLVNGLDVNYPCSPSCALFGDCVTAFESQKKSKARTNADRIRSMSDEELAEFFEELCYDSMPHRAKYWLHWLQMPAEGE